MKIRVVSICYNEAQMLPFYLRHYGMIADEIIVYDDNSTDRSRHILRHHHLVRLLQCPFSGLDDTKAMELWYHNLEMSVGECDWIMFPDIDELLYAKQGMRELLSSVGEQYDVIQSNAYNMVGNGLPKDNGKQLWELVPHGVESPIYSKAIILKPGTKIEWHRGRHKIESCSGRVSPPLVKLLHYRYMGFDYTRERNKRNYLRVGEDKGAAWSCSDAWKGEHSPEWAESVKKSTLNALEADPWPLSKYS